MLFLNQEFNCTGCGACLNICKMNAIQMKYNKYGVILPEIDSDKCVECNQCVNICPLDNVNLKKNSLDKADVYAMQSKDNYLRYHSTSGGAFSELANKIFEHGGSVAGAIYKEDFSVEHCLIHSIDDLEMLRRSKYQQSDIGLIYQEIEKILLAGKKVLFCGTPCQAGGLKAYLRQNYDNLYICDFICRGVPSPKLFQEYIKFLEKKYNSKVTSVWMKNKKNGWHSLTTVITFENGAEYVSSGLNDSYVQLFLKYNIGIRPSCYECKFKGDNSCADITLGDFWGLDGTDLDDNIGTSVVICRTSNGKDLFNEVKDSILFKHMKIDDVVAGNPCLMRSVERVDKLLEDEFWQNLNLYGYEKAFQILTEKRNG